MPTKAIEHLLKNKGFAKIQCILEDAAGCIIKAELTYICLFINIFHQEDDNSFVWIKGRDSSETKWLSKSKHPEASLYSWCKMCIELSTELNFNIEEKESVKHNFSFRTEFQH